MRFWVGVSAAFGAGTLIGAAIGILSVEDKLKKEYAASSAAMRRSYEALKIDAETPVDHEDQLEIDFNEITHLVRKDPEGVRLEGSRVESISLDTTPNAFGETVEVFDMKDRKPKKADLGSENPYHSAVSTEVYASFAELDEEEYYEEDGRIKDQIIMTFEENAPRFFNQGEEIDDAFERVGGTIVDDMRKAVGEGNPVLYVRNNQTEVDYEVLFEQP